LLPSGPDCGVLVTSRHRLSGLVAGDGLRRVEIGLLTPEQSQLVLSGFVGAARVEAEPEPAVELARLCGYLPLALRLCAARLADEAEALSSLAVLDTRQGRLGQAVGRHEQAIVGLSELDQQYRLAEALVRFGHTLVAALRPDEAAVYWLRAREMFAGLGNHRAGATVARLLVEALDRGAPAPPGRGPAGG
jgi:hypothetical protein